MTPEQLIASKERPFGHVFVPERALSEAVDPQAEQRAERRWAPVLESLGIKPLGIRDVPTERMNVEVDGIEWELGPIARNKTHKVPPEVFHRVRAAEASGVPFAHWLWGEEHFVRPPIALRPRAQTIRDPILIGVIPTSVGRGLWALLGLWFH